LRPKLASAGSAPEISATDHAAGITRRNRREALTLRKIASPMRRRSGVRPRLDFADHGAPAL